MAQDFSFDVVSKVDLQAVEDAVNTVNKEITTRFDFKGSISRLELDKKTSEIKLVAEDDNRLRALRDMLQTRMIKRGAPIKNLENKDPEDAGGGTKRQTVKVLQGFSSEKAKEIVAAIKKSGLKVTPSIQAEQVRVSARSKDDLQNAIALLRGADFGQDLQFVNYR